MHELWLTLTHYLQYPFVWRALAVGVLIALCSAVLGVALVLRRFSFIGDGLSHVAFGAMAIAAVVGLVDNMLIVLPVTVLSAVLLLQGGERSHVRGDAAIATVSVGALALGYLMLHLFSPSANVSADVCGTLFGSVAILTLSRMDVILCLLLSFLVLMAFVLLYHKLFCVTFDESFAAASGIRVRLCNLALAVMCAGIIVLAMKLVGSLLVSALIVLPALCAMRLRHTFRGVLIASAVISVCGAVVGMLTAILFSTPVGATVVAVDLLLFGILSLVGVCRRS